VTLTRQALAKRVVCTVRDWSREVAGWIAVSDAKTAAHVPGS
jgi:hypothetical protein